ncbi:hypothetical protein VTG60DRAFT_4019 [Thermothelomyces hinnuleus]
MPTASISPGPDSLPSADVDAVAGAETVAAGAATGPTTTPAATESRTSTTTTTTTTTTTKATKALRGSVRSHEARTRLKISCAPGSYPPSPPARGAAGTTPRGQ